jgi:hypothetical protein
MVIVNSPEGRGRMVLRAFFDRRETASPWFDDGDAVISGREANPESPDFPDAQLRI